jgi:rhodanese-related sulfurtransferase
MSRNTLYKALEAIQKHIPLIDVRSKQEYEAGHFAGAVNIPLSALESADIQNGSYIYCRTGGRAGMAKEILAKRNIVVENIGGVEGVDAKDLVQGN